MDLALAQKICNELNKGNTHAILELMELYGTYLEKYAEKQLKRYSSHLTFYYKSDISGHNRTVNLTDDLLQNFWVEIIIDKKIVCDYEARNNASLKSFLISVLFYYIESYCRNIIRRREVQHEPALMNIHEEADELSPKEDMILLHIHDKDALNDDLQQKLIKKFVNTALERLSVMMPNDAMLLLLRMNGLTYRSIALQYVNDPEDEKALAAKEKALRKQCTRKGTGAYDRFTVIFNNVLNENGYVFNIEDNKPRLERRS